jgi:hypothetical protein
VEIVAVGMQDFKATGVDRLYVRVAPDVVNVFDVFTDGHVVQVNPEPLPERAVTAAIEKFNATFRLVPPLKIQNPSELPRYLGAFEVVSETQVRKKP